ncbi:cupin domain-containing protein [Thermodesulfobacteriota bacterium]
MTESETNETANQEPKTDLAELGRDRWKRMLEGYKKGKRVIKFKDLKWEKSKQSILKWYSSPHKQDMAAPFWLVFLHHVVTQSGKHIHQGGLPIFVIEGKGHSVVDGVRYDWKKGDLLLLPITPGGVEHQHFNENPEEPADWLAIRWYPVLDYLANTTKQVETHPDWTTEK